MARLITPMTTDQIRAHRERMAPSSSVVNRKPKRDRSRAKKAAAVEMIPLAFWRRCHLDSDERIADLQIYTSGQRSWGIWHDRHSMVEAQTSAVWSGLHTGYASLDRASITHVELVRISPGTLDEHDNLPSAFKAILDATCAWIVEGERVFDADFNRRSIGKYDDKLLRTKRNPNGRVTCGYDQATSHSRPRAYGIQIRLRLSPPECSEAT